ncbi:MULTISPECIES: oligopeptidase A [Methylomonas]|uniref:oligopeptidase A n=2 Tax=Methylomonas TaxID=416 RepID=A0A126T5G1_9GAMM|nr:MULTISPECIES: oligopeptidase A [Methylomonas]AMK77308.1 oligopeptidase A [Methylomonas denitrificans]OAH97808.1 oligopeptidase A [Methylomonas methanica]
MTNPLLENTELPQFSKILPEHVEPAINQLLSEARQTIARQLETGGPYTWQNLIEPIEAAEDRLNKAWSPVSHMNSVVNSEAMRDAYNACLGKLSEYSTETGQNRALYEAYQAIHDSTDFAKLDRAQQKIVNNALRDFHLSGVDLPAEQQARYKDINQQLSKLASQYEENLLDATNAWHKQITHIADLAGLPESALAQAKQAAEAEGKDGWLINLQFPSYLAVMTYADNRELRREHYEAFCTRASDQGPHAGQWDNSEIMEQILALRHEKAQLLGFNNYAEYSLATKMAKSTDDVVKFLEDLADKSWRQARRDLTELKEFAAAEHGLNDLQAWDIGYYSEKMRQHFYQLSQEEVKAYFPDNKVVPGLFAIVEKLYGLQISEIKDFETWHPDARFYQILDKNGQLRGRFFLDLYARAKKRGGAWMDDCVCRKKVGDELQTPVAYLTCNFTPPTGNDPALLTHDEVETLFHEFGHGLHHMLTQIDHLGVSGINGVEWDAVELPSQFMENWCWEKEALSLISGHYQTGEPLPDALYDKMLAAKNFQAGMMMVRQLEFSLFDFKMHQHYSPAKGGQIYSILKQVRDQVAVVNVPDFNRFAHSFSHIFAGGYAAGYYSYKWAEVLSADAFSLFEEKGIFDQTTGAAFLHNILEQGGSSDAMTLFKNFRGREPNIDALLRHNGIAA